MRILPRSDTVFHLCMAIALAFVIFMLVTSCGYPRPDLDKVPRGQISRVVSVEGQTCRAWIPLIVRAELGQEYLAAALAAAQPWADALRFAVAVPALEGEDATVTVSLDACPPEYVTKTAPYCARLAQTHQYCDGGVYRQDIQIFVPGDSAALYLVLMHELGHALGVNSGADAFGHSPDARSIMFHELSDSGLTVRPADVASVRKVWGL